MKTLLFYLCVMAANLLNLSRLVLFLLIAGTASCQDNRQQNSHSQSKNMQDSGQPDSASGNPNAASYSEEQWRQVLSPDQFYVLREKGTERAFTGEFWNHHASGEYYCAGCGAVLFYSDSKFDSGCGWPSFSDMADSTRIIRKEDYSHGMYRIEVICANCKGHLGHVFEDGPKPTGLRYCINSLSIKFRKKG
jgi:peptide-methionine (R)-S-oxide reductase